MNSEKNSNNEVLSKSFYHTKDLTNFLLNYSLIISIVQQNLDLTSFKKSFFNSKYILNISKHFKESPQSSKLYVILITIFFICIEQAKAINNKDNKLYEEISVYAKKANEIKKDETDWIPHLLFVFLTHFRCFYDFYFLYKVANLNSKTDYGSFFNKEFGFILEIGKLYESKVNLISSVLQKFGFLSFSDNVMQDLQVFKDKILNNYEAKILEFSKNIPPITLNKMESSSNIFESRSILSKSYQYIKDAFTSKSVLGENGEKIIMQPVISKNDIAFPNLLNKFRQTMLQSDGLLKERLDNLISYSYPFGERTDLLYLIPYLVSSKDYANMATLDIKSKNTQQIISSFNYFIFIKNIYKFSDKNYQRRSESLGYISNFLEVVIMEYFLNKAITTENNMFDTFKQNNYTIDFYTFFLENSYELKYHKGNKVFEKIARLNHQFDKSLPFDVSLHASFIYQKLMTQYIITRIKSKSQEIQNTFKELDKKLIEYKESGENLTPEERDEALNNLITNIIKPFYFPINYQYYITDIIMDNIKRLDVSNENHRNEKIDTDFLSFNSQIIEALTTEILTALQNGAGVKN